MFNRLNNKQDGIAHLAIVAVIVLAGVGGAGYYVMTKNKEKKSDSSSSAQAIVANKEVASACEKEINDKDFCKFASNFSELNNYTTTISSSSPEGSSVMKIEAENADKSKTTMTTDGVETAAFVTIGKDFYTKDFSDNKWTKFTSSSADTEVSTDIKDDVKIDFADGGVSENGTITYKSLGKEPCGNLTCFKYQIVDSADASSEQFIWFDTKDYLLRRLTMKEGGNTSDMVLTYGKVSVSAPSPVKELPTGGTEIPADIQAQIDAAMQATEE